MHRRYQVPNGLFQLAISAMRLSPPILLALLLEGILAFPAAVGVGGIGWRLICSDGTARSGRTPLRGEVDAIPGARCSSVTLEFDVEAETALTVEARSPTSADLPANLDQLDRRSASTTPSQESHV